MVIFMVIFMMIIWEMDMKWYEDNGYEWKYGGVLKGGYPQ